MAARRAGRRRRRFSGRSPMPFGPFRPVGAPSGTPSGARSGAWSRSRSPGSVGRPRRCLELAGHATGVVCRTGTFRRRVPARRAGHLPRIRDRRAQRNHDRCRCVATFATGAGVAGMPGRSGQHVWSPGGTVGRLVDVPRGEAIAGAGAGMRTDTAVVLGHPSAAAGPPISLIDGAGAISDPAAEIG